MGPLLSVVRVDVCRQRVLELGKGRDGPVVRGDVQLVYGLTVRDGQTAVRAAVEGAVEGHDLVRLRARRAVDHRRFELLGGRTGETVRRAPGVRDRDVHLLHGVLVGARSAHLGGDVRQPRGRDAHQRGLDPLRPARGGQVEERGSVRQPGQVGGISEHVEHSWIIVPDREGRDVREHVQHAVTVDVHDVIAARLFHVDEVLDRAGLLGRAELRAHALGLRAGTRRAHRWTGRLTPGERRLRLYVRDRREIRSARERSPLGSSG